MQSYDFLLNYNIISIVVVLYHIGILSTVSEHESMNIAFIHNRFPAEGAERITADIAGYLAPLGNYRIFVYASHIGKAYRTRSRFAKIMFIV